MQIRHSPLVAAIIATLLLAGCGKSPAPATDAESADSGATTAVGRQAERAMADARRKLESGNIRLNSAGNGLNIGSFGLGERDPDLPEAEITPAGDFIVDGHRIALDDGQRQAVLAYRARLLDVTGAGMAIGANGADLGMRAAGEAMKGIFTGNADEVGRRIEAEAEALKADAKGLCERLAPLLAAQDTLAAQVPEFAPYARMDAEDISNCMDDTAASDDAGRAQVRDDIRDSIRSAVRSATSGIGGGSTVTVDGIRLLLPSGSTEVESARDTTRVRHADGTDVRIDGNGMEIDGRRYPRPARGAEVDLRSAGTVRIDGREMAAQP